MNEACTGWSPSLTASPSIVVIFLFCAIMASVKQDKTRAPLTCTVQAPQAPWSHPFFVPINPNRSRKASNRVVRVSIASLSFLPFTSKAQSRELLRSGSFEGSTRPRRIASAAGEPTKGTATVSPAEIAARRPIKSRLEETVPESGKEFEGGSVDESALCSISNQQEKFGASSLRHNGPFSLDVKTPVVLPKNAERKCATESQLDSWILLESLKSKTTNDPCANTKKT